MQMAVYPGTFDPVHCGHIDIATRAASIFDKLIVGVYDRPWKNLMFSLAERVDMMSEALADLPSVEVVGYSGLTVEFVRKHGAGVIVRGLRVTSDFELEYQMALTNKKLAPDLDTVCLVTSLDYAFLSSSIVKDVAMSGGCIKALTPPHVIAAIKAKLKEARGAGRLRAVSSGEWPT
jgi:pantetheine-phosphate adenylyltransferase